jgi:hypothetical protein
MTMIRSELDREYHWRQARLNGEDWSELPMWARDLLEEQHRHITTKVEEPRTHAVNLAVDRLKDLKETLSCVMTDFLAHARSTSPNEKVTLHKNVEEGLKSAKRARNKLEKDLGRYA